MPPLLCAESKREQKSRSQWPVGLPPDSFPPLRRHGGNGQTWLDFSLGPMIPHGSPIAMKSLMTYGIHGGVSEGAA
jgi:hypothetical protein